MGRKKLTLKFIESKRCRTSTFNKRMPGLMKKAYELSTLCNISLFIICFGLGGEVYTYPDDDPAVRDIIARYRSLSKSEQDRHRYNISGHLKEEIQRKRSKLQMELNLSLEAIDETIRLLGNKISLERAKLNPTKFDSLLDSSNANFCFTSQRQSTNNEWFEGENMANWQGCLQDVGNCSSSMIDPSYHFEDQALEPTCVLSNNPGFEYPYVTTPFNLHEISNAHMAINTLSDHQFKQPDSMPSIFMPMPNNLPSYQSDACTSTYQCNASTNNTAFLHPESCCFKGLGDIDAPQNNGYLAEFLDAFEGSSSMDAAAMPYDITDATYLFDLKP